MQRDDFFVTKC